MGWVSYLIKVGSSVVATTLPVVMWWFAFYSESLQADLYRFFAIVSTALLVLLLFRLPSVSSSALVLAGFSSLAWVFHYFGVTDGMVLIYIFSAVALFVWQCSLSPWRWDITFAMILFGLLTAVFLVAYSMRFYFFDVFLVVFAGYSVVSSLLTLVFLRDRETKHEEMLWSAYNLFHFLQRVAVIAVAYYAVRSEDLGLLAASYSYEILYVSGIALGFSVVFVPKRKWPYVYQLTTTLFLIFVAIQGVSELLIPLALMLVCQVLLHLDNFPSKKGMYYDIVHRLEYGALGGVTSVIMILLLLALKDYLNNLLLAAWLLLLFVVGMLGWFRSMTGVLPEKGRELSLDRQMIIHASLIGTVLFWPW